MDLDLIERLMIILEKSALETLDVSENGIRIRLSKAGGRPAGDTTPDQPQPVSSSGEHLILAGLTGTFYRAPSPGADPYVKEGDTITEGQVLGLVEAMKMLNPVEADMDGIVEAILVSDAEPVVPGQPLIRIARKPSDV